MQDRFAEQTRRQIAVSERLSAQRNALEELCLRIISEVEGMTGTSMSAWREELEAARMKGVDLDELPHDDGGGANGVPG